MLGMGCVILLWHSLDLPFNYFIQTAKYILRLEEYTKKIDSFSDKMSQ